MEISYNELKCKEIVNLADGKRMGKTLDLIFDSSGTNVLGLVAMGSRKLFSKNEDIFIPWDNIQKIGNDVILINLVLCDSSRGGSKQKEESCDDFLFSS